MLRRVSVSESPPNFSSAARASTSATMVSTTTPAAGTAHTSERWWIATASSPVAMSTVASARGTVEIGFIAARTRSGWPLVMPPSRPPARLVERTTPSGAGVHLVVGLAAAAARGLETVADLDALDRLDAHDGGGQLAVQPVVAAGERTQPDRQAQRHDLHHAAEGVAVLLGRLDLGDHGLLGGLVEGAHRAGVDRGQVFGARRRTVVGRRRADRDDVREHLDTERLTQKRPRDGPRRDAGGGLAGAGPLQHRPGVVEAVLEHARVVGVAGPRPGERRVARDVGQFGRVDRVGGHHGFPLRPFGVADLDGDGPAQGDAVAHPGQHGHRVALELHPRAATVAEAAAGQLVADFGGGDLHAGDHAFDHGHQRAAMGFSGGDPAQHGSHSPMGAAQD